MNRKITPSALIGMFACGIVIALLFNHAIAGAEESVLEFPNNYVQGMQDAPLHLLTHPFDLSHSDVGLSWTLAGFVIPLLAWWYLMVGRGNYRPGEEHGSARWLTMKEAKEFGDWKQPENNIILSKDCRMVLQPKGFNLERDRNKNVLIVGGPGSGKTRYVIKPNLMQLNSSVWVTDPKGTLLPEVGQMFIDAGYSVRTLNTIDFNLSMHFNPFAYIEKDEDIPSLVQCLVQNVKPKDAGKAGDPFWEQCEKMLLNALVGYMCEAMPLEKRTFRTLSKLIGMIEISENNDRARSPLDFVFDAWETGKMPGPMVKGRLTAEQNAFISDAGPHPDSYAVAQYKKFKVGAGKTLKSVLMSVNSDLWQFSLPELLNLTDYDEMDLDSIGGLVPEDLEKRREKDPGICEPGGGVPCGKNEAAPRGQRKTAMFVIMNDSDSTFGFLVAVLTYLGFTRIKNYADTKCLHSGGKLPVPVEYYLDEFANIGKIADFEQLITTLRSRNIAVTMVLQSLSQLDNVYGKEQGSIIKDACDSWVYLGGSGVDTCEVISKKLGNETVNTRSSSRTYAQQKSSSQNEQILQRPLMDLSEVMRMERKDCLVMITGTYGFKDRKYLIEDHPNYELIDPGHKAGKRGRFKWPKAKYDKGLDIAEWRRRMQVRQVLDGIKLDEEGDIELAEELGATLSELLSLKYLQRRPDEEIDRYLDSLKDLDDEELRRLIADSDADKDAA